MRPCLFALPLFFFSACSSLFYYPDSTLYYPPKNFGFDATEFRFSSAEDHRLVGWIIRAKTGPYLGTILQFHGNAENMSSHYLSLAWLTEHGYDLMTFDYRGYGGSEGEPSPEGTAQDGVAAIRKAREFFEERKKDFRPPYARPKFIVYGQSLGGAIAGRALELSDVKDVDQVIFESTFYSYQSVASRVMRGGVVTWPLHPLAYVLISDSQSSKRYLESTAHPPFLVIHSKNDQVMPFEMGESLFAVATPPKKFWIVEETGHLELFYSPSGKPHRENRQRLLQEIRF